MELCGGWLLKNTDISVELRGKQRKRIRGNHETGNDHNTIPARNRRTKRPGRTITDSNTDLLDTG
jgi:hypothetical protein